MENQKARERKPDYSGLSPVRKLTRILDDIGDVFREKRPRVFVIAFIAVVLSVLAGWLYVKELSGTIWEKDEQIKDRDQEILKLTTEIAPFRVMAHLKYPDQPEDKRLDILLDEIFRISGKVDQLASATITRPSLTHTDAKVQRTAHGYVMSWILRNHGIRPARLASEEAVVLNQDLSGKPYYCFNTISPDLVVRGEDHNGLKQLTEYTSDTIPPKYIIQVITYHDAETGEKYQEIFLRKWQGVQDGKIGSVYLMLGYDIRKVATRVDLSKLLPQSHLRKR